MNWEKLKPLIFNLDAERAHSLFAAGIKTLGDLSPRVLEFLSGQKSLPKTFAFFGKALASPIGLAAGFDKNAELLPYLPSLGFGFAEIGSVTLRAQPGNPRPRLFRGEECLFNFMGFNNDGAEAIAHRMANYSLPSNFAVGINLGLNKTTPHEQAAQEFGETFNLLADWGDYFVVNVSSPNTPGLRALQEIVSIEKIFRRIKNLRSDKPIYLKLAPEISGERLGEFLRRADDLGVDGFVLTNTLGGEREGQSGGWSGERVHAASTENLAYARPRTTKPLISVGGIMTIEGGLERMRLGADLIQIYTGWIFRGPKFPAQLAQAWSKI